MKEKKSVKKFVKEDETLQHFINGFPTTMGLIPIAAKFYKAMFESLTKEGFTEYQALEIIKGRGMLL